jgi:fatty acid desaturase
VPHKAETLAIRAAITKDEERVRAAYPWLKHQDFLAISLWACSIACIVASIACYARGILPLVITFPLVAFAASLLHELEHDLIHKLYFLKRPFVQVS